MKEPPTQTSLGQYAPGRKPIAEWLQHIRNLPPIPHARHPPRVKIGEYALPGTEKVLAFFYCTGDSDQVRYDRHAGPQEVMAPLYALARDLIRDGWAIEDCDVLLGARDGLIVPRLVASRWIDGEVMSERYVRRLENPHEGEAVPIRCSEVWA